VAEKYLGSLPLHVQPFSHTSPAVSDASLQLQRFRHGMIEAKVPEREWTRKKAPEYSDEIRRTGFPPLKNAQSLFAI